MRAMAHAFLARHGNEEARLESDLLVAHALGLDRLGLLMKLDAQLQTSEVDRARELLVRRSKHEPVAYITGSREFYGRAILVGSGALVPRPETELLVDLARSWYSDWAVAENNSCARVLDLGTGSGCLAATLALELEEARVLAVDRSEEALAWAQRNVEALELAERVELALGDGLELAEARGPFDLLVSNPPYVDPASAASLAADVRDHEPGMALFAPDQDLDFWARELLQRSRSLLAPGGMLLVELGYDQGPRVLEIAQGLGLQVELRKDLAGIERVLEARA
ncbi:MAG: release factor glutamine methyltransferase [Planctomycetota bacterium]|jgi:release factor glutamine methyltransferase